MEEKKKKRLVPLHKMYNLVLAKPQKGAVANLQALAVENLAQKQFQTIVNVQNN